MITQNDEYPSVSIYPTSDERSSRHHHQPQHRNMTTKRATSYGHPHQQRRPPDVEEALSSMLWTPYERASNTDTSSEDEDEQLNRQLRKSKSQYDYTSIPTIPPSPTPPTPPLLLPATNIVAYIPTPTRVAMPGIATSNGLVSAATTYYAAEDLCDATVTTPLVPFSNLMLSANAGHLTATAAADAVVATTCTNTTSTIAVAVDDAHNNCYPNETTLADTSSSFALPLENHKNRFSYPSYGRIPGLTKWWSSNSNTNSCSGPCTANAPAPDPSPATATSQPMSTTMSSSGGTSTASTATPSDASDAKEPPSYESLYSKQQRQRRRAATTARRHSKHLNIFKPVLETLKANVSTITQGRFAGISSSSSRHDNSRVNTNTTNNSRNSSTNHSPGNGNSNGRSNNHPTSNGCNTGTTTQHLVHSFTDDFLTEHCSIIHRQQHVAATNVDNEHIINNNNNNNNNTSHCSIITTIDESTEPAVQQEQPHQHHQHHHHHHPQPSDDEEEEAETLIHRPKQLGEHDRNVIVTNTIAQQTVEEQQEEQETENKQNNNFIICQQQRPPAPAQAPPRYEQTHSEAYEQSKDNEKMNTITSVQMNPPPQPGHVMFREPGELMYSAYCHSNPMLRGLPYEATTSSPISLTRSFEVNTTYGSLTGFASQRNSDTSTFKTSFEATASTDCDTTTTATTYNLTPNKCLAELERLYAEFRASESLREKRLRETQGNDDARETGRRSSENSENMRLNVPAHATSSTDAVADAIKTSDATKMNPSTSSVFLTTTNSVTALTNPCQRTPSLTIQVNQNTSNSNNNNNNNNNNNVGEHQENASQIVLNQAIVNTTTTKNGVSVINCNYVNNANNNSNNNNNNKSITNLCDIATNTNLNLSHVNNSNVYPSPKNLNANNGKSNGCSSSDSSDPPKNNTNSSDTNPSGNSSPHHHSSVPKVFNNESNNNNNNNANREQQNVANTSVNVIQVNGNNAATTTTTTTPLSPSRTFTSTECQTDDIASVQLRSPRPLPPHPTPSATSATMANNRDQRRRERRERRHLHHTASMMVAPSHSHHPVRHSHVDRHSMPAPPLPPILHPPHMHPGLAQSPHNVAMLRPMLPDILHNHYPPPYSALPPPPPMGVSGSMPNHPSGNAMPTFAHAGPPPPPPGATLLGPAPQPPPPGTTLLTSVISTVPIPGATPMVSDGRFTLPLPIIRRSPSERSGKGCCGQWFAGPPLRALIAVVALGGVACALGGAALGATGLAGPPSSHFTAALLMIGVGVVLVTVSGAAWRMTAPGGPPCLGLGSSVDLGRCGRRPCSRGGGAPQGLLYPEFQHRPPPPSYQASMQEYRLRLLLLDRDRQNGVVRGSSPPPTYRSHAGSLLRAPLTSTIRGTGGGIGASGRADGSIGGSEYSFPPSYRSRNTTPGTISSERSIETEPSGRLLANEDIPEPLSVEQLSEYNTLQQRTMQARMSSTPAAATTTTTTSMANITGSGQNKTKSEEKRNSLQLDKSCIITKRDSSSDKKDDLVTIVTITPQNSDTPDNMENQHNTNLDVIQSGSREQIEILAHL